MTAIRFVDDDTGTWVCYVECTGTAEIVHAVRTQFGAAARVDFRAQQAYDDGYRSPITTRNY